MYQQIIDQITHKVITGDWSLGQLLPSIRELAAANQISVITVKRAYSELEHAGVIVTQPGKGSFVAAKPELPKSLLQSELDQHLVALLGCAKKLALSRQELKERVDAALTASKLLNEEKTS